MIITVPITKYEKIELDERQQLEITNIYLRKKFNISKGMFLKDNKVFEEVEKIFIPFLVSD